MKNNKNKNENITFNGVVMNSKKITFKDLILEYLIKEIKKEENGL